MKKVALCVFKILLSLTLFVFFCVSVTAVRGYCAGPKVSIVIPVYNVDRGLLRNCLDSVKNQTLKNIEIICVDDGSTDGSAALLDEYARCDARFKVYRQKNGGPSLARNRGIELASGEYIQFVDSDDKILENMSEKLYNLAKQEGADIVRCGFHAVKSFRSFNRIIPSQRHFEFKFAFFGAGYVWNGLYRLRFLEENGLKFDESSSFAEDLAFNMICFPKAKKIAGCPDRLYYHTYNFNSLTRKRNNEKALKSLAQNFNFVYKNWKNSGYFENNNARFEFLKWFLHFNGWLKTDGACELFINAIGEELQEDSTINLLPSKERLVFRDMKVRCLNKSIGR